MTWYVATSTARPSWVRSAHASAANRARIRRPVRTGFMRASILFHLDDAHRAVDRRLPDLLLVRIEVGVGAGPAVVALEDEHFGAHLDAQVAQDAAVFDPDPGQAHDADSFRRGMRWCEG